MTLALDISRDCAVCGAMASLRLSRRLTETCDILRCARCRTVRIEAPSKRQDNQTDVARWRAAAEAQWRRYAEDVFAWIGRHHPVRGRALEVGCSVGVFMETARCLGLDVEGIDIDADAVAFGVARGRAIRVGTVEDCRGPYDLVYCNHVFEHMSDPARFVRGVRAVLAPGGAFAAAMPFAGLEARVKGHRWIGWRPLEHHWLYSRRGLRLLLEREGFEVRAISVRNGAPSERLSDHRSPWAIARYTARTLLRAAATLTGTGAQIFVVAVRR